MLRIQWIALSIFILFQLPLIALNNSKFIVKDYSWDDGTKLELAWEIPLEFQNIELLQADSAQNYISLAKPECNIGSYIVSDLSPNTEYSFKLTAYNIVKNDSLVYFRKAVPIQQWFYLRKLPILIIFISIAIAILLYINLARRGKELYIRRINGLDSMEEAIGRATEKGKPILFVPGIGDLDDIQTLASMTILSHLSQKAAEYNAEIIVPVNHSMVLSAAKEVVKEAYLKAGRPDSYRSESVFYLTDDQFGYVAGIDGIMLREQPAANFFLGTFFAESLILAETGFGTGAMQTAGTAQPHQIPFFVVSCDYTLIGEELFAASAYLSKDPQQLGSLKGHDFGKLLMVILIITGVILEMIGYHWFTNMFIIE